MTIGETLARLLQDRGMTEADLDFAADWVPCTTFCLLASKVDINPTLAQDLERVLGIPAGFWLERQMRHNGRTKAEVG